jgi:tRNA(Arg) A34 adenosine deaminase TadA
MDADLLRRAVALATAARDAGNHPYGSLLASAVGEVLLDTQNIEVTESDVTGHAEINLVRLASRAYGRSKLAGTTLYASTEPCGVCSGASYWSGIGPVVSALAGSELIALTGDDPETRRSTCPAGRCSPPGCGRSRSSVSTRCPRRSRSTATSGTRLADGRH